MGTDDLEFRQSKNGITTRYAFHKDHLKYEAQGEDGDVAFIIPYTAQTADKRVIKVRKVILLWSAIAFWALGAARLATDMFSSAPLWAGLILLGIAAILYGAYQFKKFSFTGLTTARGQLVILHDTQHDKILDKLMSRRKAQILDQFHQTNYAGNPQIKLRAIHWMWENEIISDTEFKAMKREIPMTTKPATNLTNRTMN